MTSRLPGIVILASGAGSNVQSIIAQVESARIKATISAVISDNPVAYALKRATAANIKTLVIERADFNTRHQWESALTASVANLKPRLVVLAGFMRILGTQFISRFDKCMMNIHPSLLPDYKGLDTHQRVLDAGERIHGATVHFVTTELDDGPLILQSRVNIDPVDSAETLRLKVLSQEHIIYPEAIRQFIDGEINFDQPQRQ